MHEIRQQPTKDNDCHEFIIKQKQNNTSNHKLETASQQKLIQIIPTKVTKIKHVKKAMVQLNSVMTYFKDIHGIDFDAIEITCPNLKPEIPAALSYFKRAEAAV